MGIGRRSLTLAVCCLAQFMCMLDVALVNVGLPAIRADLGFSAGGLQWVVNAYALAAAGCLLLGGRAADLLGRRAVLVAGLATFGLASLAAGLAQEPAMLVAARAAQGLGGAVVAPTSLSILAVTHAVGPERNRAFGLWGTMGALGGVSGALLGGVLTATLSWRWTLLVNVPLALGLAALALRAIPALGRPAGAARSFDLRGALAVSAGMVLLTFGVSGTRVHGWSAAATLGPIAGGCALLGVFAVIEARLASAPLVPARVARSRPLAAAAATIFCLGATTVPMWFFVSLYVQGVLGFSALQTGLTFAPMSLAIAGCTQLASRLAARVGPGRVLAAGMTTLATGMLLLARVDAGGTWATDVLGPSMLCAAGIGCSFVSTTIAATTAVAREDSGLASGTVNMAFQLGGAVGLAVLATTDSFARAFAGGGAFALAGAAVALAVLARRPRLVPLDLAFRESERKELS